jgi:hypothetical protein
MNIIEIQQYIKPGDEDLVEYIYHDREYKEKREDLGEIQEYFERILRENIYNNFYLEEKRVQTKDIQISFREDKLDIKIEPAIEGTKVAILGGTKVCYHVLPKKEESSDILYGFTTNFTGTIHISIGGSVICEYNVEKGETHYFPLPIFIFMLKYHNFEIFVTKSDIEYEKTKINLQGIKIGEEMKKYESKYFSIQGEKYTSGMFATFSLDNIKVIKNVYQDYPFIHKIIVNPQTFSIINLSLYNMKILEFHFKNSSGKRRITKRTKKISNELIMKTWSPERVEDWCLPIEVN